MSCSSHRAINWLSKDLEGVVCLQFWCFNGAFLELECSQFIFIGGLVSRGKKVKQLFNDMSHVTNVIMFHFWFIFNNSFDTICLKWAFGLREWRYSTLKWQFLPLERLLMLNHLLKKIMKEGMVFVLRRKERQAERWGLGEWELTPTNFRSQCASWGWKWVGKAGWDLSRSLLATDWQKNTWGWRETSRCGFSL